MSSIRPFALLVLLVALATSGVSCASSDDADARPTVVATTSILGDVVAEIVGDDADVVVLMPAGADPHDFQPSARAIAELREADMVVANGLGFEEGLSDVLATAEDDGVPVYEVAVEVDPIDEDPHFFTDPERMADGVGLIAAELAEGTAELDTAAVRQRADAYAAELRSASAEIARQLDTVPPDRRTLVTNHDVFTYFADRYGFEVVGVVIPGGGTGGEPSADELAALAEVVRDEGVPAVFADASSPAELAETIAEEAGTDVEVVDLFTESLGGPGSGGETYLEMIQTNADRITAALAPD